MTESSPSDRELAPGTFLGAYRIDGLLGAGGMGTVYKARQVHLQRVVALKVMKPALAADEEFCERFMREARAGAMIDHPRVVRIHDADNRDGRLYQVFEFIPGGDLAQMLEKQGPLPAAEALRLIAECADGLAAIHATGMLHRDIKPQNIFLDAKGQAKLGDLGMARLADGGDQLTGTGAVMGTPAYMAPEQARGGLIDERADLYALGATLYTLLTARKPFPGGNTLEVIARVIADPTPDPRAVVPAVPGAVAALVARAMAKDPAKRIASAEELRDEAAKLQGKVRDAPAKATVTGAKAPVSSARTPVAEKTPGAKTPATAPAPGRPGAVRPEQRLAPATSGTKRGVVIAAGAAGVVVVAVVVALAMGGSRAPAASVNPDAGGTAATAPAEGPVAAQPPAQAVSGSAAPPVAQSVPPGPAPSASAAAPLEHDDAWSADPVGTVAAPWAGAVGQDRWGRWADLTVGGVTQRFRLIPSGHFTMGATPEQSMHTPNTPPHPVTLTRPFWLADTVCTQELWHAVTGANPSIHTGEANLPVDTVSWLDCQDFLAKLRAAVPAAPARMPYEAEWEFACRAGNPGSYAEADLAPLAWFNHNSAGHSHPVKLKAANGFGLYDMYGNMQTWTGDWYAPYPADGHAERDPHGPDEGTFRTLRGHAWFYGVDGCRADVRQCSEPGVHFGMVGLRVAIEAPAP